MTGRPEFSHRSTTGVSRRRLLEAGSIGLWGLSLADAASGRAVADDANFDDLPNFGKAKRCVLLYLFGAAPQHETFDPKPDAPAEIQGDLKAIPTSLPGVGFCEGLPQTAQIADRLAVVRSMSHAYPLHGVAYALTGLPTYSPDIETKPRDPVQWPYFGSMADYYWDQQAQATQPAGTTHRKSVLQHVGLPWVFNSQVDDLGLLAGPYATFLGQQYDPVWGKFEGQGLKTAPKCRHEQPKEYQDPYAACSRDSRFVFEGAGKLTEGVNDARFALRQTLLREFDDVRFEADRAAAISNYSGQQAQALSLLTSAHLRQALDISLEKETERERYGFTLFGQSCLAARRLLEAGSRFVSVFWDPYGTYFSGAWDTHQNHYPRLKEYLLPGFDRAFATFIRDLEERGLLDDTLVVCTTEHGRTPQIDSKPVGAARHHWSKAYSTVLAGGGAPRGAVIGRTDSIGGEVAETPISPKDIQATAFHLLGIPVRTVVHDRQNRPFPIAGDGQVRPELVG